jgi:hypothetical protein
LLWLSLLKERTVSEKEKAEVRHKHLDVRLAITEELDAESQKPLANAKDLYAAAKPGLMLPSSRRRTLPCAHSPSMSGSEQWLSRSRTCGTRMKHSTASLILSSKPS